MLPPFADVRREPVLTRMQIEVPSSVEYPHQLDLWQMRQGRFLLTRWNRLLLALLFGILGAEGWSYFSTGRCFFLRGAIDDEVQHLA